MPSAGNDNGTKEGEDDLTQSDNDHLVKTSAIYLCGETVCTLDE